MPRNVAIKCTYNDGDEGLYVGFNGTCSEDIIKQNIENGRVWCSSKDCKCKKYFKNGLKGKRPTDPCLESVLFRKWEFGAGTYHSGKRANTPIHLSDVGKGKIAILTTRFPGDNEIDRKIIGFFKIGKITNNKDEETKIFADNNYRIRLPLEEAKELYFWDYYSTKGGAAWGTGLIRYLEDGPVARILHDLRETLRDEKSKELVSALLDQDFQGIVIPQASGPRVKKSGNRAKRMAISRKYGPGGEGEDHKKLKDWIANNPQELGFKKVKVAEVEYVFPSGDTADILFKVTNNKDAVVEIKTIDVVSGFYQALKYRVLRCAERNLSIDSSDVEGILVAWEIPKIIKNLCDRYGIKYLEIQL